MFCNNRVLIILSFFYYFSAVLFVCMWYFYSIHHASFIAASLSDMIYLRFFTGYHIAPLTWLLRTYRIYHCSTYIMEDYPRRTKFYCWNQSKQERTVV